MDLQDTDIEFSSKNKKNIDAGELLIRYLEQIGVEYVFGVPGGAIEPIYNALARSERRGGPKAVVARHEAGAAYMADGYMRETGKLGVCIATSGPGATNLITGVSCAYDNNIPMLAITGQPALPSFGKGALQESSCTGVDIVNMFSNCTRYNSLISHSNQVETKLVNAILRAHQAPQGPAHLSIPVDILRNPIDSAELHYDLAEQLNNKSLMVDDTAINKLFNKLSDANNVVFFIGNGAIEAIDLIIKLVDITHAQFVTTPDAKGLINPSHPSYRGVFGFGGHSSAEKCLRNNVDIILAFGTGFGELSSSGWCDSILNSRLIHIDESEDNLIRSPMAKLHVKGHIRTTCARLIEKLLISSHQKIVSTNNYTKHHLNPHLDFENIGSYTSDANPIKPQRLMKELSDRFPPHTRFLADTGNSMIWAAHYLQPHNRREPSIYKTNTNQVLIEQRSHKSNWLRITLDFATMGWAIGAAVGIARGNPKCPTVCITGDGAYLMCGQEITVAAQEELPVIFVILNDGAYGMVKHGQRLAGAEPIAHELNEINFKQLAESMNIPAHIINAPDDFDNIDFDQLMNRKGPTLFDVRIDKEEAPPMTLRLKALGSFKE